MEGEVVCVSEVVESDANESLERGPQRRRDTAGPPSSEQGVAGRMRIQRAGGRACRVQVMSRHTNTSAHQDSHEAAKHLPDLSRLTRPVAHVSSTVATVQVSIASGRWYTHPCY